MNLAMEMTKEYVAGGLRRDYGDCFIRGNNGKPLKLSFAFAIAFIHVNSYVHFGLIIGT